MQDSTGKLASGAIANLIDEVGGAGGVERILVLQLAGEQAQELSRGQRRRRIRRRRRGGGRRGRRR